MIGATVQPRLQEAWRRTTLGGTLRRLSPEQSTLTPKAAASSTAAPRNCAACMTAGTMETTVRVSITEQLRGRPCTRRAVDLGGAL